ISRAVLSAILELALIRGLLNGMLNSAFGIAGTPNALPTLGSAMGNVFHQGYVKPHRTGDVVTRPSVFPMGGGRFGSVAEEAPEVILPLERGADGRLGVIAHGNARPIHIEQHFHF